MSTNLADARFDGRRRSTSIATLKFTIGRRKPPVEFVSVILTALTRESIPQRILIMLILLVRQAASVSVLATGLYYGGFRLNNQTLAHNLRTYPTVISFQRHSKNTYHNNNNVLIQQA